MPGPPGGSSQHSPKFRIWIGEGEVCRRRGKQEGDGGREEGISGKEGEGGSGRGKESIEDE